MSPAEHHREVAGRFSEVVHGVSDWSAPTPVAAWQARDVVHHLVDWLPDLLASGGVDLATSAERDPVVAWDHHVAAVQALLDGPQAAETFTHEHLGSQPLDVTIDRFYVTDVWMHTWDLARASGQDDSLGEQTCAEALERMGDIEDLLRSSGQFGSAVPVPGDASAQDRFVGFIGRDPAWRPPG